MDYWSKGCWVTQCGFLQTHLHYLKNVDIKDRDEDGKCRENKEVREKLKRCEKQIKSVKNQQQIVNRSPSYWKGHVFLFHIFKTLFISAFTSI